MNFCFLAFIIFIGLTAHSKPIDTLVLGDSQVTFSGTRAYHDFFKDITQNCKEFWNNEQESYYSTNNVGVIGVRSTSFNSWTSTGGANKDAICKKGKWSNSSTYGAFGAPFLRYEQIGNRAHTKICRTNTAPIDIILNELYDPKLLVMIHMGNTAIRWNKHPKTAELDFKKLRDSVPKNIPCLLMTSTPTIKKSRNQTRLQAQTVGYKAFKKVSSHCSFIKGFTPDLIKAFENDKTLAAYIKRKEKRDPFHPSIKGVKTYLSYHRKTICKEIKNQLKKKIFN